MTYPQYIKQTTNRGYIKNLPVKIITVSGNLKDALCELTFNDGVKAIGWWPLSLIKRSKLNFSQKQ